MAAQGRGTGAVSGAGQHTNANEEWLTSVHDAHHFACLSVQVEVQV